VNAALVDGFAAPDFDPLRELLARRIADGSEAGASLAVIHDGELVVDLWGGEAAPGRPWQGDTLTQVWSVTKTLAALTVLVLVDRGVIDLDEPVATYWPEFDHGDVLVRHLLSHTSGFAGWTEPCDAATLLDLRRSEAMLAAQEPWFAPGSAAGYHMISYGHLLDGLVRGAVGRPLADVFATEIAEPLGADVHLGVPTTALPRCADLIGPTERLDLSDLPEGSQLIRTLTNPVLAIELCNSPAWREVSVAGVNGHANARGIALASAAISHGGSWQGQRLLSSATLDRILEPQASGQDLVLPVEITWGLGFALSEPVSGVPAAMRRAWWTGYGGAIVIHDLDRRLTLAYAMNRLVPHLISSPRTDDYVRTTYRCLEAR
jgi:CubicO group peptidase (beta-lactamase class C family)